MDILSNVLIGVVVVIGVLLMARLIMKWGFSTKDISYKIGSEVELPEMELKRLLRENASLREKLQNAIDQKEAQEKQLKLSYDRVKNEYSETHVRLKELETLSESQKSELEKKILNLTSELDNSNKHFNELNDENTQLRFRNGEIFNDLVRFTEVLIEHHSFQMYLFDFYGNSILNAQKQWKEMQDSSEENKYSEATASFIESLKNPDGASTEAKSEITV